MTCNPETILSSVYQDAQSQPSDQCLPSALNELLQMMAKRAEDQKAALGALITVLVYKICHPEQDIRYHQERMPNGYSARTFDTKYVTPFMKAYFPRYAMRESAWLTRSIEQPHPFTSDFPGRIRNADVKKAFLTLIDAVQANAALAQPMLTALFRFLLAQSAEDTPSVTSPSGDISVERVVSRFQRHLDQTLDKSGTARLPVLAIYAVYQILMTDVRRYHGKVLKALHAHTSADRRARSAGDIEIVNADGSLFEVVEIKHRKPITPIMLEDAAEKLMRIRSFPERYYLLTTHDPNILTEDAERTARKISALQVQYGCQFIVNGILPSLKYYLRLISDPSQWMLNYSELVNTDPALKSAHRSVWSRLIEG